MQLVIRITFVIMLVFQMSIPPSMANPTNVLNPDSQSVLNSETQRNPNSNNILAAFTDKEQLWIQSHPQVTLAVNPDLAPVESFDQNGNYVGLVADVIEHISKVSNLSFKVIRTESWDESVALLQAGEVNMLPLAFSEGRNSNQALFTRSYMDYPNVILVNNDQKEVATLNDLKGKKVVVVNEWSSEYELKNHYPTIDTLLELNSKDALDKLLLGQVDAMVHYFPAASYELLKRGIGSVRVAGSAGVANGVMAVHNTLPLLHSIVQKSLDSLDESTLDKLASKWLTNTSTTLEQDIPFSEQERQWLKDNPVVVAAHASDWKPFSYTQDGESQGFSVEYAKLLFKRIGHELEFVSGSWDEIYNKALNNEVDMILNLTRTPEREKNHFYYTPSYARNPNVIITRKSSSYKSIDSLLGKKVSFVEDSFLQDILSRYEVNLSPRTDTLQALEALHRKEVEAVFAPAVVARHLMLENALFDLEITSEFVEANSELDKINIGVPQAKPLFHSILVKAMKYIDMSKVDDLRQNILEVESTQNLFLSEQEIESVMERTKLSVLVVDDNGDFGSPQGKLSIPSDLLNAVGNKVGVEFDYQRNQGSENRIESLTNREPEVVIGNQDLLIDNRTYTNKKPLYSSYYSVAMPNSAGPITSISELTPESVIGVVGSNLYIEELNATYPDVYFAKVLDEKAGLQELKRGAFDGLIGDGMNLEHHIHRNEWLDIDIALVTNKKIQYLVAFSNQVDKSLISALDKAKKRLTLDDYSAIYTANDTWPVTPNEGRLKHQEMYSESPIDSELVMKVVIGITVVFLVLLFASLLLSKYLSKSAISSLSPKKLMWVASMFIAGVLSVVSIAAYVVIGKVEQQTRHNVQISLSGITEALNTSIDIWIDNKKSYVNTLAQDPLLLPMVERLLEVKETKEEIKFSTELIDLRAYFTAHQTMHDEQGFFIISKNRINIASMRDSNLVQVNVIQQQRPELLDRVFLGETVLVTPIASDIGRKGKDIDATMFFAAPIYNESREVIAAMTVRYDPTYEFNQLFSSGRVGHTGESYAFDSKGYFLSQSRFEDELKAAKLLEQESNSILNLRMVKPTAELGGEVSNYLFEDDSFTKAYFGALRDTKGSSGEGYIDYRGYSVLGSWAWREDDQFGFVTEIDEEEAMTSYISTRNLIVSLLSFTVLLTIGLTGLILWLGRKTQAILMASNEELERSVRERTLSLTSIIETAIDGIIVINHQGEIVEFSPAAEKIFGYQKGEVVGTDIRLLLESVDGSELPDEPSVCKEMEYLARHKNGGLIAIEISAAEAHIGRELLFTCMVRDITQRKAIQNDLERAKNEAEEATKYKSDFLANMSHEIRTPMNAIIGMSYLVQQTELTRKQSDYVSKILVASKSLLGLINDILDFSKIEAGKLDIESVPFSLDSVMDNLSDIVTVKSQEKNLEFLISMDPTIPASLIGDPLRISQILLNLANNAVKFTHYGEIVVKVEVISQSDSNVKLLFCVQDSGIGMTEKQMTRLFQAFSQADSSTTSRYGGTGLGLTISKNLVELMDGRIGCDSTSGVGSVFYFEVELGIDHAVAVKAPRLSKDYSSMKTLIVDDSEESRDILINLTRHLGLSADAVDTGMMALIQLSEADNRGEPYDLVLVDYKMPNMNGLDTVESLRKLNLSVEPKVVMVTAYGQEELRKNAKNIELDGFLVKPVSSSVLFDAISNAFDSNARPETISQSAQPFSVALEKGVQDAEVLLVEDNEVNQQVAIELLSLAQVRVTVANNGLEAVERVQQQEFDLVLMDIQMPEMDGYLATEIIRTELNMTALPIVAMTANAMASDKEKCLQVGMNDHVAKPIDPSALFSVLNQWIEHKARPIALPVMSDPNTVLPELAGFDVQEAVARLGGRVQSYNRALSMVGDSLLESLTTIQNALESNETERAILASHTIKGVSGNIGCRELAETSGNLERFLRTESIRETDTSEVSTLVEKVEVSAQQALKVISQYLQTLSPEKPAASFDLDKVQALIMQLAAEIEEYDTSAADTCESLLVYLNEPDLLPLGQQLARYVSGYEFDEALEHLQLIAQQVELRVS
ncbi:MULTISPECIES: response regulator [Vibrio]|uniref:response regulator n=1 Tax=Vibrio TaxID=662 RepID=UPI00142F177A|nr:MULTISPECIES: transporter substrate-binding domain-containing protein [Vibrio]